MAPRKKTAPESVRFKFILLMVFFGQMNLSQWIFHSRSSFSRPKRLNRLRMEKWRRHQSRKNCRMRPSSMWVTNVNNFLQKQNEKNTSFIIIYQIKSDVPTQNELPAKSKKIDAYLSFEVCKSCHTYRRRAAERFAEISELLPSKNFELLINEHGPPRRGAFEISVLRKVDDTSDATLIWSGLKKGPPRRLKFPETQDIIELVTKAV